MQSIFFSIVFQRIVFVMNCTVCFERSSWIIVGVNEITSNKRIENDDMIIEIIQRESMDDNREISIEIFQ